MTRGAGPTLSTLGRSAVVGEGEGAQVREVHQGQVDDSGGDDGGYIN